MEKDKERKFFCWAKKEMMFIKINEIPEALYTPSLLHFLLFYDL
jgi:hypothetical protein